MKFQRIAIPQILRITKLKSSLISISFIYLSIMAPPAIGQINVFADFLSGPTGSPPTSTDPAFWTSGGGSNSDGIIGVTSDGLLVIDGGSVLDLNHLDLGQNPGVTGTVNVMGAGSTINLGSHFHIGAHADTASTLDGGNGILAITGGGLVHVVSDIWLGDSAASTGTAIVDGAGSILRTDDDLWLGDDGIGSLTIQNGGLVEVADVTDVGDDPGGSGILIIEGAGSILRTRDIDIGDDGHGQATVSNGALLEASDDIRIAADVTGRGSVLTVQGANTAITAVDGISVGVRELGTLNISGGARAEGEVIRLGDFETGIGVINIQGANSTIVSRDNYLVGHSGSGNLVVSDGARAEAGHFFFLGINPGATGEVTVQGAGSTLETITGGFTLSEGGTASLKVLEGGQVTVFAETTIGNGATGSGTVTVSGNNSLLTSVDLIVGASGKGELNVFKGGQVTVTNGVVVGESSHGGIVNVRGAGSNISADALDLGTVGASKFNVSESGSAGFATADISANSTVNLIVSSNNMLTATTSYTNNGTSNFIAGHQLAAGTYTPIGSPSYLGLGSYVGIGGRTSILANVPTFTVSSIITDAGDGIESMLNGGDRVQFGNVMVALNENAGTGGILAVTDLNLSTVLSFGAIDGYSFAATGLDTDLTAGVSFFIGIEDSDVLEVFRRITGSGDNTWVRYDAMITDDTNGWFTFTVNGLDGFDYALAAVPEPHTYALLFGMLAIGLVLFRRRSTHNRHV